MISNEKIYDLMCDIRHETEKHSALLKLLVRERTSSAIELVVDIVKGTPGVAIDSERLERELQKSRYWTVQLMRKASALNPNMKFLPGNSETQQRARVVWLEKADLTRMEEIRQMVDAQEEIPLRAVAKHYGVDFRTARLAMEGFSEQYPAYEVYEKEEYHSGRLKKEDGIVLRHRRVETR